MKEGWTYKKLGEVCELLNGFAFQSKNYVQEGIRVIRITNVQKGYVEDSDPKYYPSETQNELSRYLLKDHDLLLSLTGNVGRVAMIDSSYLPAYLNQRVACIRIKKGANLDISFLFHLLYSKKFEEDCIKSSKGAAQLNMSTIWLASYYLPVPPLPEQLAIVARLDSAFAHIDSLKANAEKQLSEARQLFKKALEEAMTPKEGWEVKTLGEITSKIGSGATPKGGKKVYINDGTALVRSLNVHNAEFKYKDLAHINQEAANQLNGVELQNDDVLFNITGASIARCCVLPNDVLPARVNQHVSILRPRKELVLPKFLCLGLLSSNHQEALLSIGMAGSTRQAVTKADLEKHIFLLPSLETQHSIVAQLDALSSHVRALEAKLRKMKDECDALKQAMLREVFE